MMPWTGELSPTFVRMIGLIDLAGGLGLILPSLTRILPGLTVIAALGCIVLQVLAAGFHGFRGEFAVLPLNALLLGLERNGLVTRTIYPTIPPRVDYELTPLGRSLIAPVAPLAERAQIHISEIENVRERFDKKSPKPGFMKALLDRRAVPTSAVFHPARQGVAAFDRQRAQPPVSAELALLDNGMPRLNSTEITNLFPKLFWRRRGRHHHLRLPRKARARQQERDRGWDKYGRVPDHAALLL